MEYHSPVLLEECVEGLSINPDGIYIDATFGDGGYSEKILILVWEIKIIESLLVKRG